MVWLLIIVQNNMMIESKHHNKIEAHVLHKDYSNNLLKTPKKSKKSKFTKKLRNWFQN